MSILERLTKRATKTAKETIIEDGRQGVSEKLDILGDLLKVGALVAITFSAIRGGKKGKAVHAIEPNDIFPIHVTNIYIGKEAGA